jgi:hypothetical protein
MQEQGLVCCHDMTAPAAHAKLTCLLWGYGNNPDLVVYLMGQNVMGEIDNKLVHAKEVRSH